MKKWALLMVSLPVFVWAGTLTILQDYQGNIGSVMMLPSSQIFYDTSTVSGSQLGVGDVTWDINISPGNNRMLVVGCGAVSSDIVSTVTVNGTTMTLATSNFGDVGTSAGTGWFYLPAPPVGDVGIRAQINSGVKDRTLCGAISFSGVNQNNPISFSTGTINYPSFSLSSTTLTTSIAREVIVDVLLDINVDNPTPGSNQSRVWFSSAPAINVVVASTRTANFPGTYDMSWTNVQTTHITSAISLKPAP